jgi:hypothetical protein
MFVRWLSWCSLAFVSLGIAAGRAHAQCPSWRTGFGLPGTDHQVKALTLFDDGSGAALYAAGSFLEGKGEILDHVAKWNGTGWSPLGSGSDEDINALAVFDDGTGPALFAGGNFGHAGGASASSIAKWNGSSWSALGSGIAGQVNALAVFDDGTGPALYAGGKFPVAGGVHANNIAKWDGSTWSRLSSGTGGTFADNSVFALAVYDDGGGPALFAGGNFTTAGGIPAPFIAKWNGIAWSSVGGGVFPDVLSLAVFDDGTGPALYAGGDFQSAGGAPAARIAKWNGVAWSGVGGGMDADVASLIVFDDGSGAALYAGGYFTVAGGHPASRIAKWNGSAWSALGSGIAGSDVAGSVLALAGVSSGPQAGLYAGGEFAHASGLFASNIARWNGSAWSQLAASTGGLDGAAVGSCALQDAGGPALFVVGDFHFAGGVDANQIARWNGVSWSALGTGIDTVYDNVLASFDDGGGPALYVGGLFNMAGGVPALDIAKWNGSAWSALGSGLNGAVNALAVFDDGSVPALYAGGDFTTAGSVSASRIAKWDGSAWSQLGSGMAGGSFTTVYALAVFDDGSGPALYAGGSFTSAGGAPASDVARWNGATWSALGSGTDNVVRVLAALNDGSGTALYAGGAFSHAGAVSANRIAHWDGSQWTPLGSGMTADVWALTSYDDGSGAAIYAGGDFSSAGGTAANHIAKWTGSAWTSVGNGLDGVTSFVRGLMPFDDGTGVSLWVTGWFHSVDGIESQNIAAWQGCAGNGTGTPYCFGDGSGTPCPCANFSLIGNREGCANSLSTGGRLRASGSASLAADTLLLLGSRMTNGSALYFQGVSEVNGGAGSVIGDGLLCATGSIKRLAVKHNSGGTSHYPSPGDPSLSVKGTVTVPGTRTYQAWYRDPANFCTSDTFNFTNGLQVVWSP